MKPKTQSLPERKWHTATKTRRVSDHPTNCVDAVGYKPSATHESQNRFCHQCKLFTCQALISKTTVKTFCETVLPRTSGLDVGRSNIDSIRNFLSEFGAVIAANKLQSTANCNQVHQHCNDILAGDSATHSRINSSMIDRVLIGRHSLCNQNEVH